MSAALRRYLEYLDAVRISHFPCCIRVPRSSVLSAAYVLVEPPPAKP